MARGRGIEAGMIGPGAVLAQVGEDIAGAADIGARAFDRSRRTAWAEQEQEFSQGLRTSQEGREAQKFDMAKALHPALLRKTMTEADVAEENYRQKIEEAGRKTQARKLTADLLDRAQQGTASSEDLLLGLTNVSWLSGNHEGFAKGMKDLTTLQEKSERGSALNAAVRGTAPAWAKAMRSGSVEDWTEFLIKLEDHPKAAGTTWVAGALKYAMEQVYANQLPGPALEAMQRWMVLQTDLKSSDAAWDRVMQESPDALRYFTKNPGQIPSTVTKAREVAFAGQKKAAEEGAVLPGKLAVERVKGEEARATEKVKGTEQRTTRTAADTAGARAILQAAQRELDSLIRAKSTGLMSVEESKRLANDILAARARVKSAEDQLRGLEKTGTTSGPKGVRADALNEIDRVASQFRNLADAAANLNRWRSAGKISPEEYDAALSKQRQRFGGQ